MAKVRLIGVQVVVQWTMLVILLMNIEHKTLWAVAIGLRYFVGCA
jgi:hypothetical protein